jgi:hypothetical protein
LKKAAQKPFAPLGLWRRHLRGSREQKIHAHWQHRDALKA